MQPELSFLLMKHADRWDLPKGHVDPGEDELTCALRELNEETGITAEDLELDSRFRFEQHYEVNNRRSGYRPMPKTLVIFLACLKREVKISATEHLGYEWFPWRPPHVLQKRTIDPLLAELQRHVAMHDPICDGQPPGEPKQS